MKSYTAKQKGERIKACGGWKVLDDKAKTILERGHPCEDELQQAWKIAGCDDGHALLDWFETHLEWWLVQQETGGAIGPKRRYA